MLIVVEVVTVAAIVFVVAALAVGRFDRMSAAPADAPFAEPLPRGPVSSADVRAARFGMSLRGYRMAEVDAVLARLADELARLADEVAWRDDELARRDMEIVKLAEFAHLGQPLAQGSGSSPEGGGTPATDRTPRVPGSSGTPGVPYAVDAPHAVDAVDVPGTPGTPGTPGMQGEDTRPSP